MGSPAAASEPIIHQAGYPLGAVLYRSIAHNEHSDVLRPVIG
jgi:hypothetical protein